MVHFVVGEEVTKLKLSACLLLNNDATIHDILEESGFGCTAERQDRGVQV